MNSMPAAPSSSAGSSPTSLIDINSATLTHLLTLPGVGTVTARAIVEGRPYASVDDLKARKVVSSKTFEKIRGQIRVKSSAGTAAGERTNTSAPGTATH
jgi:DNA uptake protein ComE-like DNA-binding protein